MREHTEQQLLLAARPPSRLQRRVAYGVMIGLLAVLCLVTPYANRPMWHATAFIPIYATAMAVFDLITAALIFSQFWVVRWTWLLVLACGFLFTGLISIPYGLTFPEGFGPSGLLGAGPETAAQLSLCSRVASPAALIAAILVRPTRGAADIGQRSPGLTILLSIALICALVIGLTWATITNDQLLPWIHVNRLQSDLGLLLPIIVLTGIPFALLWIWGRSVLDLWLMVMCCSWVFDLTLVIVAGARYSVGWYAARTFQVAAIFSVLLLYLSETTALYANLARGVILRRGAQHVQQISMDVMAASLGHEIKQPLTGMLLNAQACLLQLKVAQPELDDVRATLSDLLEDGRQINEIISGARAMFKESAHDRQLLDVNKVVRSALATVDLEIQQQGVSVNMELDDGLPPVFADSGQLHQVFLNLMTNALEAMAAVPQRPPALRVTSGMVQGSSDIAVAVEDTGIGITDQESKRILEPFFSTKAAGTGVGLTICRVILKAHGGDLQISATKPHGTVARVVLPTGGYESHTDQPGHTKPT